MSNNPLVGISGEMDSAAEDCATGIALASVEGTGQIVMVDLKQVPQLAVTPPTTTLGPSWSAP